MKHKHLNVPSHWQNYWTRYPEGHTILEALIQWVSQVDIMSENLNDINDKMKDFIAQFDNELQTTVSDIINEWEQSGFLTIVIANAVEWELDAYKVANDAEVAVIKNTLTGHTDDISDLNDNLMTSVNDINTNITELSERLIVNVKDFGAIGDGVTNDTLAIQSAINAMGARGGTVLFPPTDGTYYRVTSLTIPSSKVVATFQGIGCAKIGFTEPIAIRNQTESTYFKNLEFTSIYQQVNETSVGTILMLDDRDHNAADFDCQINGCFISPFQIVVKTKGRGVEILNSQMTSISDTIIHISVPAKENFIPGGHNDIQSYETGFRGYSVKNCRMHYCHLATIILVKADPLRVAYGFTITGNMIEGAIRYFSGFAHDLTISGNSHYNNQKQHSALLSLSGFRNAYIELNVNGRQADKHLLTGRTQRVLYCEGLEESSNLFVRGFVRGLEGNAFTFIGTCKNINIDFNISDAYNSSWAPSMVTFGPGTFSGVKVAGIYETTVPGAWGIMNDAGAPLNNINYDGLIVYGNNPAGVKKT